ncbi:hypothetical protein V8Q34_22400 [Blautia sp. JLR.GB0024]|uniref:hypothetical protein n=1 Tax=Blautia sp. JLR.GB0024 TaxID=3123295 RepID=UPI003006107B
MIDKEKRAHDLAILYIQAEIKNGQIETPEDYYLDDFVSLYYDHYNEILKIIEKSY